MHTHPAHSDDEPEAGITDARRDSESGKIARAAAVHRIGWFAGSTDTLIGPGVTPLRVAGIEESKQSLRLRLLIRTGRSPDERALARVLLRRAQVTAAVNAVGRRTRNACVEKTSPSVGLLVFCVLCCVRGFR
jgi:hypothetical protein